MKIRLWLVRTLLALLMLGVGALVVGFVYVRLRDVSEEQAISAATQAALAYLTLVLVGFTVWQVGLSRRATQQTAHDALLERLDARGPRATVRFSWLHASLDQKVEVEGSYGDPLTHRRSWEQEDKTGPDARPRYVIRDDNESVENYNLELRCAFEVEAFGDSPVFVTVIPGPLADPDAKTSQVVVPGAKQHVGYAKMLPGGTIRELAQGGYSKAKWSWELGKVIVRVADPTNTVWDDYHFTLDWWPFERHDDELWIYLGKPNGDVSPVVQALRDYDTDMARNHTPAE